MSDQGHILIADDEETFLHATAELIRQAGYTCDCVPDGVSAAVWLRDGTYDVLIADIRMPGNQHLELIRDLPEYARGLPVILVTGHPTMDSAVQAIQLPVVAYLVKPVDFDELLAHIRSAIARTHTYRAVRRLHQRVQDWQRDLRRIEQGSQAKLVDLPAVPVETVVPITLHNIAKSLAELQQSLEAPAEEDLQSDRGRVHTESELAPFSTDVSLSTIDARMKQLENLVQTLIDGPKATDTRKDGDDRYFQLETLAELQGLSHREWQVLHRLYTNQRVPSIAQALSLSPHTVRNHLKSIFRKVGVCSQSELLLLLEAKRTKATGTS